MKHAHCLALFAGAIVAVPVAIDDFKPFAIRAPSSAGSDWQGIWAAEMASMVSVQNAMATPGYAPAQPPAVTSTLAAPTALASPSSSAATQSSANLSAPLIKASAAPAKLSEASASASSSSQIVSSGSLITNAEAFTNGFAIKSLDASSGASSSASSYQCFGDTAASFPPTSAWISWDSMWANAASSGIITNACQNLNSAWANTTPRQLDMIRAGVEAVSAETAVDPRFILAVILQESKGCVNVGTTSNGVSNPGLMQSHAGTSFVGGAASDAQQQASITQMIRDGVAGTSSGDGLAQGIQAFGEGWTAARAYNSGCADRENLSNGVGATASYVNDVANYVVGWLDTKGAKATCANFVDTGPSACDARA